MDDLKNLKILMMVDHVKRTVENYKGLGNDIRSYFISPVEYLVFNGKQT